MKTIQVVFSGFTLIVAGLGLAGFATMIGDAKSAPQEAALAAMVLAIVVPMYVIARCIEMMRSKDQ